MAYIICCGNIENANDITQETFLRMLNYKERYCEGGNIKVWAYVIMCNIYKNLQKREQFRWNALINTEEYIERDYELYYDIISGIKTLPLSARESMLLYLRGFSYKEIAKATGVNVSTVRGRIFTARRRLINIIDHF